MAVEFLDEPATALTGRGVDWIAEPPGVEFTADPPTPAAPNEIARRFLDPAYQPTLAEFKTYQAARKGRTIGEHLRDDLSLVGDSIAGLWETAVRGVKALPAMAMDPETNDPILTAAEGVKRGTMRDLELARKLLPSEMLGRFGSSKLNFDQYAAVKLAQLNDQKFRYQPLTPENAHTQLTRDDVPPEVLSQWRNEFDAQYAPQADYESFLAKRQTAREEIAKASEKIPGVSTDIAEAQSLVTSPMALVPFGKAITPAKTITRAIAARTLEGAGKTFEWVGEKTLQAAKLPERAVGAITRAATGSEEAAAAAQKVVGRGSIGATLVSPAVAIPGLTETAAGITAGKVAGKTAAAAGKTAAAAGRAIAQGPSRFGVFDTIAKDGLAPEWLRRVAKVARPLDPAISLAGTVASGATEGAAIGAVLGGLAEGEEGAASGLGAGLALGAGGALAGRLAFSGAHRRGLEDLDIARWLASKTAEEVLNLRNLDLTRSQALALADTERIARGVSEPGKPGDVEFQYLSDQEFAQKFGPGKGAQTLAGDRPVVFINTGYRGPRSVFHEVLHALDALEGFAPQRQALNRILFDQTLPDGTTLSRGIYSAADLAEFTRQYRDRLNNDSARAEFDLLTPEERTQRILAEVRSESFANLLAGRGGSAFPGRFGSLRARVADAMLTADHATMLGRMRRALESIGVKFDASGEPSELFVRNGRPITNTPAVDAALRDYLRAKNQITRKLTANDDGETPSVVVRPEDFARNPGLVDSFRDADLFARNPDGSVRVTVRPGDVARIEAQEQAAIKAARDAEAVAESARQAADAAERAIADAEARSAESERIAKESTDRLAVAVARADKVRWREARRRGEAQLKEARAREKAAREQARAAGEQTVKLKNARLSAGVPVLLSESEIRLLQARRTDAMLAALDSTPDAGAPGAMRKKANGAYEGKFFSDKQLAALQALPDDILSPSMKDKLAALNALAQDDGAQIILDYNAALKGGRYSSGISATTRAAVPLTFNISKASNFFISTLDTTHFFHKLADWRRSKPRAFDAWGGDVDAFLRDSFAYLDNHVNGRPGSVNLDSDAATAVHKKNVINDFFNVPKGKGNEDLNPVQLSTRSDKDNLIRARRFDRINRITPGAGDKFPVRYQLQKVNFLPGRPIASKGAKFLPAASPVEVIKQTRNQAVFDLAQKVPGPPNFGNWLADVYVGALDKRLNARSSATRTAQLQRVADVAAATSPQEMTASLVALLSNGRDGAKEHLDRLAVLKALKTGR